MRSVAAIAMVALVLVLAGGGSLLVRIDNLRREDSAHDARLKLLDARLELARAELALSQRDLKPDNRVEVLARRTDALRGAILGLVRTGKVSLVGDPGWDWSAWPVELASRPELGGNDGL
jgi:hypothetical protein